MTTAVVAGDAVISTYCAYGLAEHAPYDDRATHRRCEKTGHGQICTCECHHQTAPPDEGESPVTTIEEHPQAQAATNGDEPRAAKRTRRKFTDAEKRRIVREYVEAPSGTAKTVLAKHDLASSVVCQWVKQFGGTTRAQSGRGDREAPLGPEPAPEPPIAPGPDTVTASELIDAERDEYGIGLAFTADELDILDVAAFLEDTDRHNLVARVITEWIATQSGDSDVRLCLAARRGRRAAAV